MLEPADGMTPQLPTMTPQEFAGRWHDAGFGERQGAQSFFNDLCGLVGHATPAAYSDPKSIATTRKFGRRPQCPGFLTTLAPAPS